MVNASFIQDTSRILSKQKLKNENEGNALLRRRKRDENVKSKRKRRPESSITAHENESVVRCSLAAKKAN